MITYKFHHVFRAAVVPLLASSARINVKAQPLEAVSRTIEPQTPTSQERARLHRVILDIAVKSNPEHSNIRPMLALPLAQLGDWNGALRLLEKDMNAPQRSDELWHWRAYQLARAGKWDEVSKCGSSHYEYFDASGYSAFRSANCHRMRYDAA